MPSPTEMAFQYNIFLHPHPAIIESIDKMIYCGDTSHGGAMYGCTHYGNLMFVPFRCKSRFCPSCSNKYNQLHSFHMFYKLISAPTGTMCSLFRKNFAYISFRIANDSIFCFPLYGRLFSVCFPK